ncbi:unnamed protein product [Mucor fragilis]
MPTSLARQLRQIICCRSADVDQNEGPPPPPSTTTPQAATTTAATEQLQQKITRQPTQSAVEANTEITEEQPEPIEEDWADEEPEPSPYKPDDFVVEKDEYSKYPYDKSPYKSFDDVQREFDAECQAYNKKSGTVDWSTIWGNREYERSIRNWNPDQEFNITPNRPQTAAI